MPRVLLVLALLARTAAADSPPGEPLEPPAPAEPEPAPAREPAPAPEPAQTPPAPPVEPPGATPAAPPPSSLEACRQNRHDLAARAAATDSPDERQRLLLAMPDCSHVAETFTPVTPQAAEPSTATAEISAGLGIFSAGSAETLTRVGLSFGVGTFVSPKVAVSLRVSGGVLADNGLLAYVGLIGPHVQVWLDDHVWIGGGAGLGVIMGCGEACDAVAGSGLDLRVGYAFSRDGYFSLETSSYAGGTSFSPPFSDMAITVTTLGLGFQAR